MKNESGSFSFGYCKASSNHRNSGLMVYVKFKTQVQSYCFADSELTEQDGRGKKTANLA